MAVRKPLCNTPLKRIFQVPFNLAKPVINAHIAAQQAQLEALSLQAVEEMK